MKQLGWLVVAWMAMVGPALAQGWEADEGLPFNTAFCSPRTQALLAQHGLASRLEARPTARRRRARPARHARRGSRGFRFAWPVGARLVVTEQVRDAARVTTLRHELSLERPRGRTGYLLRVHDTRLVDVDGEPLTPEALLAIALPGSLDLNISRSGRFRGVASWEGVAARMASLLGSAFPELSEPAARVADLVDDPARRSLLGGASGTPASNWRGWVAGWIGFSLAAGSERETPRQAGFAGQRVPALVRQEHLGQTGGQARLATEIVMDGEAFQAAYARLDPTVAATRMRARVAATVDAATLCPQRVMIARSLTRDGEVSEESRSFAFAWSGSGSAEGMTAGLAGR